MIVLFLIFVFHATTNTLVIVQDRAPLFSQEALFFESSWHMLKGEPLNPKDSYPPLHRLISLPYYVVFGYSPDVALLSMLSASLVLILSVYSIGKELQDSSTGLLSAMLTVLLPGIFAFSRTYWPEPALAAAVALSLALMLKTHWFSHRHYTFAFGISIGLGLLAKFSYPLFLMGPFLLYLYLSYTRIRHNARLRDSMLRGGWLLASIFGGMLIASLGHGTNLKGVAQYVYSGAIDRSGAEVFSSGDALFYIRDLGSTQLGWFFFVAALVSFVYLIVKRRETVMPLFLWFIVPYLFLSFVTVRNYVGRFALAYLPAFALVIAISCMSLRPGQKRAAVMIVLIAGFFQFFMLSFPRGPMDSPNRDEEPMLRPDPRDWQLGEVIGMFNDALGNRSDPHVTSVSFPVYDPPTLQYLQHMNLLVPFESYSARACFDGGHCDGNTYEFYEELFSNSDIVLIKTGIKPPTISPLARQEYDSALLAWSVTLPLFKQTRSIVFPNGEEVRVYVQSADET